MDNRLKSLDVFRGMTVFFMIIRTAIIFFLGYLMYWFPFFDWDLESGFSFRPISETRIMGVLQRIALAFGLSSILLYKFSLRTALYITVGILVGYWLLMYGLGDYTLQGNFGQKLDLILLGSGHLYGGEGLPFDPEGLLSTLPCIGNTVAGYATVHYLKTINGMEVKFKLALAGAALLALGFLWHYGFPINKKLWSSSFVLLTSGISMLLLLGLHYLLDINSDHKKWPSLFTPMGKNPLFIYVLSQVGMTILNWWPSAAHGSMYGSTYVNIFKPFGEYFGAFLFAFTWTMICWAVAWWMDKKKIYIKV